MKKEIRDRTSYALTRAHHWLEKRVRNKSIRAVSLAVQKDGITIDRWADGGWSTESGKFVAAAPETRFLVASLTKPITATAIMQLVEDWRTDPINSRGEGLGRFFWCG